MYQRILVPIDGSTTAQNGLTEAIKLAKSEGSTICLLYIVNELIYSDGINTDLFAGNIVESLRSEGEKIVAEAERLVRLCGLIPVSVILECMGGSTAELIVSQAEKWCANLIVLGTHGRRGLRRFAMGSDAENVVRLANIPVLMVHGRPQAAASTPHHVLKGLRDAPVRA